jgi:hypothetical protein
VIVDSFGPDPSVVLPSLAVAPLRTGPLYRIEYVIELVGPRTVPAASAARLLDSDWYGALGSPTMWAMRPADTAWQPMTNSMDGSYDSIALAWRIITARGSIGRAAADRLFEVAERFAGEIGRRAVAVPTPEEVETQAKDLGQITDYLDAGIGAAIGGTAPFVERDIWTVCSALGLEFTPSGEFAWRADGRTLFAVSPVGDFERFSLAGVQAGNRHEGLSIGFRIAVCPDPPAALAGMWHAAKVLAQRLGGVVFDDSERPLTASAERAAEQELRQALQLFVRAKLVPGSAEAIGLFEA